MAVKPELIKARLRALFPKANLSTKRLDEISARLAKKPEDDADETAIDEVITDYDENGAMTFEEIAKADDKIRTLEAGKKTEVIKVEEEIKAEDGEPEWFTKYKQDQDSKFKALESQNVGKTRLEIASAKFKGYPDEVKDDLLSDIASMNFSDDNAFTSFLERKETTFKGIAEKHKLSGFGNDSVASSTDTTAAGGKVKQISKAEAEKIADGL